MTLANVQSLFQDALLSGSDEVLGFIPDSPREKSDVLLGVYRDGYTQRLLDILRDDFERLHTYLGDDTFDTMARAFIASHPSRSRNARYYSQEFASFADQSEVARANALVGPLAQLEGLLNEIFDLAHAPALSLVDLQTFAAESFAQLTFVPHPCVRRLDGPAGLEATFTALSSNSAPPPPPPSDTDHLIVWRQDMVPHYRAMSTEEAMLWDFVEKEAPFGILCEMAAAYDDPTNAALRVAGYLQGWITTGLLSCARLTP